MEIKIKRGQILKDLRKNYTKQKLNQADVANIIGVSVQAYQKYEYGTAEPTFDTINKLADFYGVTTDYLLGRQEATDSKKPLDEFAQREHLKTLEKLFMQKYLNLTSEQRDKVLDFLREIVADEAAAAAAAEEARNNMEIVRTAARKPTANNAPHTEAYPKELLDEMDRTAPRTDSDM